MNPEEQDLLIDWLPKSQREDLWHAVSTDRRLKIELYIAGALAIALPAIVGLSMFPLIRSLSAVGRFALMAIPIGLLAVCLRSVGPVADWCHRRAQLRLARARGLIR